ncbi:phosphoribosylformylglycinamidine synthase subunit I [Antricoccus suffuscus]|uniref:Phosphoribosylformylglycinamidine synthase subunit PurQ n=1 Tax=Antricoccus suffuscus TaxID=1629062 RepID=A0A2T1A1U0_9ACTN|nr:phosphoribosylformylglycinamidine synthase subunit PurQ [Antricoccus suffuscus]PRZ42553.1 phosphoribosylformylglycinamidine synthase subunit I [Antricoccus suffuscus]
MARIGIVTFPGSLDEQDCARAVRRAGAEAVALWHGDHDLHNVEAIILPGGFSYGDALRCGAIAKFSPVMGEVIDAAKRGVPILGICNGFQILCEAHLLPGVLTRNAHLHYRTKDQSLRMENTTTPWTSAYAPNAEVVIPVKHGEGRYVADEPVLDALESEGRVIARYVGGNPNGSARDIAGITDATGRIVGLMPHPEHAIDPLTGPTDDGLGFFTSALNALSGVGA